MGPRLCSLEALGGLLAVLGEEEVAADQVDGADGTHDLQDVAHLAGKKKRRRADRTNCQRRLTARWSGLRWIEKDLRL